MRGLFWLLYFPLLRLFRCLLFWSPKVQARVRMLSGSPETVPVGESARRAASHW